MSSNLLSAPTRRIFLVGSASSVLLAGCSNLIGPTNAAQLYVLSPDLRALSDAPKVSWELAVARPETAESLNTDRIALRRGQMMDYFADSQWTDDTPQLLQTLLVEAFEKSGRINAVAKDIEGIHADIVLQTELRAFEARYDDDNSPPTVVVDIMAKILNAINREIIAVHEARQETKASANSVAAVVAAFGPATTAVLEDIATWALGAGSIPDDTIAAKPSGKRSRR